MSTATHRIPARQRRSFLHWGLGLSVLPAVLTTARWQAAGWLGAWPFDLGALVVDLVYLNMAFGRVVVAPNGIISKRFLSTRSWTWEEIESVRVVTTGDGKSSPFDRVAVRTTGGREKLLAVPYSTLWLSDATFRQTADQIIAAWQLRSPGAVSDLTGAPARSAQVGYEVWRRIRMVLAGRRRAVRRMVAILLMVAGLGVWASCASTEVAARQFEEHGVRTTATVFWVVPINGSDNCVVQFNDPALGFQQSADIGNVPLGATAGDHISIVYNPKDPINALDLPALQHSLWVKPAWQLPLGLALVGIGVLVLRRRRRDVPTGSAMLAYGMNERSW